MLIEILNIKIGYNKAAEIANEALKNGTSLKEEAIRLGYVTHEQYNQWIIPSIKTKQDEE
jgi:fumarate hydratase class II